MNLCDENFTLDIFLFFVCYPYSVFCLLPLFVRFLFVSGQGCHIPVSVQYDVVLKARECSQKGGRLVKEILI